MATTTDHSSTNHFDRLPNELLEKIFISLNNSLLLTPYNHVRVEPNSYYFDYFMQQPLLKQTHAELLQVSLVCRRFYQIIKTALFWEQKCRQDRVLLPSQSFPIDFTAYEKLYVINPFHPSCNLLKDNKWTRSYQSQSQIESVPHGCHRLYDEFNRLTPCRATSYTTAEFFQRDVQLSSPEHTPIDFVQLRPVIEFSICIAARWDCGSRCSVTLIFSDGHNWKYEKVFPQWSDQKWHRVTYHYGEYNQFPSSVTVCVAGSDTQFWAGFFGSKFAQARLRFLLRTNENGMNTEDVVVIEPKVDDELVQVVEPSSPFQDELPVDSQSRSSLEAVWTHSDDENTSDYDDDDDDG